MLGITSMGISTLGIILILLASSIYSGFSISEQKHYKVRCQTTKGNQLPSVHFVCWFFLIRVITSCEGLFVIEVIPEWAPIGAWHFLELVVDGFYTDIAFFRCVKGFLTQFGISDKREKKHWHGMNIPDDPSQGRPIEKHVVSYAGGGPNTRSTQLFIAFEYLDFLGNEPWEVPFGKVSKLRCDFVCKMGLTAMQW